MKKPYTPVFQHQMCNMRNFEVQWLYFDERSGAKTIIYNNWLNAAFHIQPIFLLLFFQSRFVRNVPVFEFLQNLVDVQL